MVLKEEDGAGAGLEAVDLALGGGPLLGGDDGLEGLGGEVPELVVLGAEEDDDAVGLRVEGAGDVLESLGHDGLDLGGADSDLLVERIVGAAVLDQREEGVGADSRGVGRDAAHFGGGGGESAGGEGGLDGGLELARLGEGARDRLEEAVHRKESTVVAVML